MKRVVFNPLAIDDLDEITHFIAQDNPVAAEKVREDLLDSSQALCQQPELGIRPRFSAHRYAGIRFIPSSRYPTYLLFYRELATEVEVLRIIHGSRNLPPLFE